VVRRPDGGPAPRPYGRSRSTIVGRTIEEAEMHQMTYDLVKLKIDEELRYAARQRQARQAVSNRPRAIDFAAIGEKLRVRLFGGPARGGRPSTAGA